MKIPGFVDLQVNGYKGIDFSSSELTEDSFCFSCEQLLEAGTAAFLPTIITSSQKLYQKNLPLIAKVIDSGKYNGQIPGIHIEGPFVSDRPGAVGAHNPKWTQKPDIQVFEKLQDLAKGHIKLVTIAAELENAQELTKYLVKAGITVSLGHQMGDYAVMKNLYSAGAKSITHLGNGMPNQVPRHENQIISALALKKLKVMLITDGHHIPDQLVNAVFNSKDIEDVIVTSDASPVAGLKPGKYNVLGNDAVLEENGLLHNPEKKCMVGSSSNMLECMNYLANLDILSVDELMKVGFDNPLDLIGADKTKINSRTQLKWNESNKKFEVKGI